MHDVWRSSLALCYVLLSFYLHTVFVFYLYFCCYFIIQWYSKVCAIFNISVGVLRSLNTRQSIVVSIVFVSFPPKKIPATVPIQPTNFAILLSITCNLIIVYWPLSVPIAAVGGIQLTCAAREWIRITWMSASKIKAPRSNIVSATSWIWIL